MAIGCILTIIATFMQTFSPFHSLATFIAGRVIIGLGQGIALTAGPIYIGELAPPEIRGKIMSFWQLFYSVGSFIAYWINYACTKHVDSLGEVSRQPRNPIPIQLICELGTLFYEEL